MAVVKRTLEATEDLAKVDAPAEAVQRLANQIYPDQRAITNQLAGAAIGHPWHSALAILPIGSWLSATVLDLFPGGQRSAQRLVLTGLVTAVPTIAAGAVDYRRLDKRQRRVGFVHLVANLTAGGCFLASYRARRRGHRLAGRAWGLIGVAAVGAGGALGGHLTYALGAGVYRWPRDRDQVEMTEQPDRPFAPAGRS